MRYIIGAVLATFIVWHVLGVVENVQAVSTAHHHKLQSI